MLEADEEGRMVDLINNILYRIIFMCEYTIAWCRKRIKTQSLNTHLDTN